MQMQRTVQILLSQVGKVPYKLHLPPKLKVHPIFHASILKPYHEDVKDLSKGVSKRTPTIVITSFDKELDEILADTINYQCKVANYK